MLNEFYFAGYIDESLKQGLFEEMSPPTAHSSSQKTCPTEELRQKRLAFLEKQSSSSSSQAESSTVTKKDSVLDDGLKGTGNIPQKDFIKLNCSPFINEEYFLAKPFLTCHICKLLMINFNSTSYDRWNMTGMLQYQCRQNSLTDLLTVYTSSCLLSDLLLCFCMHR